MIRPQGFPRTKRRRKANGEYDDEILRGRSMSRPTAPREQNRLCGRLHHRFRQANRPRGHAHRAFSGGNAWCRVGYRITFGTFICIFFYFTKKRNTDFPPQRAFHRGGPLLASLACCNCCTCCSSDFGSVILDLSNQHAVGRRELRASAFVS